MNTDKQVKQRQLDNERVLIKLLRDKETKETSKIEQLRSDIEAYAPQRALRVVKK